MKIQIVMLIVIGTIFAEIENLPDYAIQSVLKQYYDNFTYFDSIYYSLKYYIDHYVQNTVLDPPEGTKISKRKFNALVFSLESQFFYVTIEDRGYGCFKRPIGYGEKMVQILLEAKIQFHVGNEENYRIFSNTPQTGLFFDRIKNYFMSKSINWYAIHEPINESKQTLLPTLQISFKDKILEGKYFMKKNVIQEEKMGLVTKLAIDIKEEPSLVSIYCFEYQKLINKGPKIPKQFLRCKILFFTDLIKLK